MHLEPCQATMMELFFERAPTQMFDRVLNTSLIEVQRMKTDNLSFNFFSFKYLFICLNRLF